MSLRKQRSIPDQDVTCGVQKLVYDFNRSAKERKPFLQENNYAPIS